MVLVNAIYFKGAWKQKFSPENTLLMDFTKQDGSVTQIPMMHLKLTTNIGTVQASVLHRVLQKVSPEFGKFLFGQIRRQHATKSESPELVNQTIDKKRTVTFINVTCSYESYRIASVLILYLISLKPIL